MGHHSAIEWTDTTWNPVTACTKVSPGGQVGYAKRLPASQSVQRGIAIEWDGEVIEEA